MEKRPGYFWLMGFCLMLLLTLTGCAALDALLLEPLYAEDGQQQYIDVAATEALPPEIKAKGDVVLVKASDRVPGREYEVAYSGEASSTLGSVGGLLNLIPGWGGLATGVLGLFGGGYAAIRGKKKINAAKAGKAAFAGLSAELVQTIEAIKAGELDEDKNGKISTDEIAAYVKKRGKDFIKPEFLAEVVRISTSTLEPSVKQKRLEELAAKTV